MQMETIIKMKKGKASPLVGARLLVTATKLPQQHLLLL